ncbi:uncharacterized protein [Choristoneura fumiferana]|uniref:uncharacterized protein n=1 Tax=Choristoneura fumiferana TaxID=7141 RepID=UPI003D156DF9
MWLKALDRFCILLLAIEIFVHPLIYIQNFLSSSSESEEVTAVNLFYGLVSSLWVVKNFTLLIVLCVACQKFYLVVEEVEKATAVISSCHASLFILQKLCKNVLRVTSCARAAGGLRAGGVVAVDAGLPLRLLALLATYTVVLLQFAFL